MKQSIFILGFFALLISGCTFSGFPWPVGSQIINGSGTVSSEERDVSGFDAVVLKGTGNLHIVHGNSESLTIKTDDNLLPYITAEVVGDQLEIGTRNGVSLKPTASIEYTLTVKSLSDVTLSGFGNVDTDSLEGSDLKVNLTGSGEVRIGKVTGPKFDLNLSGFGNVYLTEVAAPDTKVKLTGSGNVKLTSLTAKSLDLVLSGMGDATVAGTVDDQKIQLTGSGNFRGGDLQSKTAKLTISGLGDATAWVTDSIDITITGSGNVEYYGSPTINTTLSGMGKIKSLGEH